jgi:hypothetical protein
MINKSGLDATFIVITIIIKIYKKHTAWSSSGKKKHTIVKSVWFYKPANANSDIDEKKLSYLQSLSQIKIFFQ